MSEEQMEGAADAAHEDPAAASEQRDGAHDQQRTEHAPTGQDGGAEAAGQGGEGAEGQGDGEGAPKPRKGSTAIQARFDEMTRERYEAQRERDEARRESEALRKLIEQRAADGDLEGFTEAEVNRRAEELASRKLNEQTQSQQIVEFNRKSNAVFNEGAKTFGEDFTESVAALRMAGVISPERIGFLEVVLDSDAPAQLLHELGQDPDEAARLASLPPHRMASELTKMAIKLAAPKAPRVSSAPPPIAPLGGKASPEVDIYDEKLSDEEYYSRRKAQGARFHA